MEEKACVVFVADMRVQADELGGQLRARGYDICLREAALDDVVAAQDGTGPVTREINACLTGAALKIFLIPATDMPPELLSAAGQAAKMPGSLVAVCAVGATVPHVFDDFAKSVVRIDNPDLLTEIISGDLHESPDGAEKPPRRPSRVKCQ
ncbi:hypothetical protein [Acidovorax sp. SUPP2825]|uniref:hypothetical protein n=1 Tax=Acidovorax sp. SUPP2825 TaxID=2920879 RepID=UPI0023DE564E|nr:hypothetical protein [Acidovorax sp. SUPP2825]GKS95391.1 hypothetical protein AVAK2825_12670 [Acidovorax sp. SUPP2825]